MVISLQSDHKLNYKCHNINQSTDTTKKAPKKKAVTIANKKTPKFKRTRDKLSNVHGRSQVYVKWGSRHPQCIIL